MSAKKYSLTLTEDELADILNLLLEVKGNPEEMERYKKIIKAIKEVMR